MKAFKLFFLLTSFFCFAQGSKYNALLIEHKYTQIQDSKDGNRNEESSLSVNKYLFLINSTEDCIIYYESNELVPISFRLSSATRKNEMKFEMIGADNDTQLRILFDDKEQKIMINEDYFLLNTSYYEYLKENLLAKKRIADFVDFFTRLFTDISKINFCFIKSKVHQQKFQDS